MKEGDKMHIVLYSTGCPRCIVLKKKLIQKNISYEECNDTNEMIKLGIEQVPVLSINGQLLNFMDANSWINERDVEK